MYRNYPIDGLKQKSTGESDCNRPIRLGRDHKIVVLEFFYPIERVINVRYVYTTYLKKISYDKRSWGGGVVLLCVIATYFR